MAKKAGWREKNFFFFLLKAALYSAVLTCVCNLSGFVRDGSKRIQNLLRTALVIAAAVFYFFLVNYRIILRFEYNGQLIS